MMAIPEKSIARASQHHRVFRALRQVCPKYELIICPAHAMYVLRIKEQAESVLKTKTKQFQTWITNTILTYNRFSFGFPQQKYEEIHLLFAPVPS
jgi:aromatic ring-opening dioxygenase catalytic subunit (LigB family)